MAVFVRRLCVLGCWWFNNVCIVVVCCLVFDVLGVCCLDVVVCCLLCVSCLLLV